VFYPLLNRLNVCYDLRRQVGYNPQILYKFVTRDETWDCSPAYCTAVYREWRYQMLQRYNLSSWRWARYCSQHVEDYNVIYILL